MLKNSVTAEPLPPSQSEWKFVEEIKQPVHKHLNWYRKSASEEEASMENGVVFHFTFPDPEKLLETAYADLERFLKLGEIGSGDFKIVTRKIETEIPEAYRFTVKADACLIEANDREGIRRGIYFLEDELLRSGGPFLKKGTSERKPFIRTRISRCFFGPLKRPPFYRDELVETADYYPEEYLNRLAYEGVNGLWITISFKDLAISDFFPADSQTVQRLEKLRSIVAKCRRYGIKIYLFCIEPVAFDAEDPILAKYPELGGSRSDGKVAFCPSSKTAENYLRTAVKSIFSEVRNLGGIIDLSVGEWHTLCCNMWEGNNCPICSKLPPWQSLAKALGAMERGMHEAAPEAEFISWHYGQPALWGMEQSIEAASHVPEGVILMHNFESYGGKEQLGKYREITDYWLSYIGPSDFFATCAGRAGATRIRMFAKLQVACSHEVATTQYIPVPGNLYKKYKEMHRLGVSGVMQSWYFGAYPSLMTKASGELAFAPFPETEDEFLLRMAQINWGKHAAEVVKAWKLFAESYDNYPLTNVLGYVGPMHDGIAWPLHLEPAYRRLAPSWRLDWPAAGDRVGESISYLMRGANDFSLDEIILLLTRMSDKWDEGVKILKRFEKFLDRNDERLKEIGVAEALSLLFHSGLNIFKFYQFRETLAQDNEIEEKLKILEQLRVIVGEEIKNSERMIGLTERDASLGFHSEAEGYKFFPEKLRYRIKLLHKLLVKEFPRVEARINKNLAPFVIPVDAETVFCPRVSESPGQAAWQKITPREMKYSGRYRIHYNGAYPEVIFEPLTDEPPCADWKAAYDDKAFYFLCQAENRKTADSFKLEMETDRLHWHEEFMVGVNGEKHHSGTKTGEVDFQTTIVDSAEKWSAMVKIPFATLDLPDGFAGELRINVIRTYQEHNEQIITSWLKPRPMRAIFILGHHNPEDFGWLVLRNEPGAGAVKPKRSRRKTRDSLAVS